MGTVVRASVFSNFVKFNTPLEGMLNYMYTDKKGLVTTGMGNLIDPVESALGLPWKRADGSSASPEEVRAEWQKVKDAWPDVQSVASKSLTSLHLDDADISFLVSSKAQQFENEMKGVLTNYDAAPADAQMAALSMAWAMGPGFVNTFKKFASAFNADDYAGAAAEATFKGVGIQPRLDANQVLFKNALSVALAGGDRDVLYWPRAVGVNDVQKVASPVKSLLLIALLVGGLGTGAYFLFRGMA